MFISHLTAGDKIFVQVDSDVDGYTSAAAFINYANMLAPGHAQQNISYRIHNGKEHGLIVDTIPKDVKLVVAPDSSSNDYEQHKTLKEQGIDVLVLDHHEADKVSEYACVINNQLSKNYLVQEQFINFVNIQTRFVIQNMLIIYQIQLPLVQQRT